MSTAWALSALWVELALVATLLATRSNVSTPVSEIVEGTIAQIPTGRSGAGTKLSKED